LDFHEMHGLKSDLQTDINLDW